MRLYANYLLWIIIFQFLTFNAYHQWKLTKYRKYNTNVEEQDPSMKSLNGLNFVSFLLLVDNIGYKRA